MWRYIVLIISFLILTILIFTNPFNFPQDIRDAITPWATLSLALVAVLTIIHSNLKEERNKKLRRLQQIMEWATDVLDTTQIIHPPAGFIKDDTGTYERFGQVDKINTFKRLSIEGEHIKIIAMGENKEMVAAVTTVLQSINDLLDEDWGAFDIKIFRDWLTEHEGRIYNNTRSLINECTRRMKNI